MENRPNEDKTHQRVKYQIRSGTTNSGWDYETNMLTLLALRCVRQNFKNFWLGTNVADVGDFDDVLLHIQEASKSSGFTFLIQLKHSTKSKKLNEQDFMSVQKGNNDFSLVKYSKNFTELKATLSSKSSDLIVNKFEPTTTKFVLFTNRPSVKHKFLENDSNNWFFLLNTNSSTKNIYKFDLTKLDCSKLNHLDYCENIRLFSNQGGVKELNSLIIGEVEKLAERMGVKNVDVKSVSDKFRTYISDWARGDLGGCFYLTKCDIACELGQLFLLPFVVNLHEECLHFDDKTKEWNEIIQDKKITVVDSGDQVVPFLKQCVATDLKHYFDGTGKSWSYVLSNEQKRLLDKNTNLEVQMLDVIGNQAKITILDIYKCLAFHGKLPILLEINSIQEYSDILKILEFSNYNFRAIIVNNTTELVADIPVTHFLTLCDLDAEKRSKILSKCVHMQGRASVMLSNLIDESMYEHIKASDVIYILTGSFNFGGRYPEYSKFSEYYIKRSLSRVIFDREALSQFTETTLIQFKVRSTETFSKNVIICTEEESVQRLEELKRETKTIHRLRHVRNGYFEWIETFGSIRNIRQHQLLQSHNVYKFLNVTSMLVPIIPTTKVHRANAFFWINFDDFLKTELVNGTHIINARPGMGKTTAIDYIAARAPIDVWVLKINLNAYEDYYKDKKSNNATADDHLQYFNTVILEKYGCQNMKVAQSLFKKFLNMKKVLLLLDAFDEVAISHVDKVTKILKCLHKHGCPILLTTRPVTKVHLEREFDTFAQTLRPWSKFDQETFLFEYFKHIIEASNVDTREFMKTFVEKLLNTARANLDDDFYCKFTSIPLQSKLLADVFLKDCEASIKSGEITFKEKFDLLDLYEEFISQKTEVLCGKFGKDAEYTRLLFEEHQQLFALKILFDDECLLELNIDRRLEDFYKGKQINIQLLQRDGFLDVTYDSKCKFIINFVHRSFAEYLAAVWLSRNIRQKDDTSAQKTACSLMAKKFSWKGERYYEFLFNTFDRIVTKECPLHVNILNGQIDEVGQVLKSDPERITELDECDRSVLHLLAFFGKHHPTHGFLDWDHFDDVVVTIIEDLPDDVISSIKDDVIGYSPLCYAIASASLAVADKICEKSGSIFIAKNSIDRSLRFTYQQYCIKLRYKSLFKLLLPYFASEDVFMRYIDRNITVGAYCKAGSCNDVLETYLNELGVTTLSKIFQFVNYYFDQLQIGVAFGSDSDVEILLTENIDVNKEDMYKNTLLHYATIHERLEIVKMLLDRGANVNKPGKDKNTPLHYAARRGNNHIILELLHKNANINELNSSGDTPLQVALENRHKDTAKLLICKGADCAINNKQGKSVLHKAVLLGDHKLVCQVLNNDVDIDHVDVNNVTSLLTAVRYGYKDIAKLLIDKGANFNVANDGNEFCLYFAVLRGDNDIVLELISAGDDVNRTYLLNGDTLLHVAVEYNRLSTIELLLSHEADCNIQNHKGKTVLHNAVKQNLDEVVSTLLAKNSNVNLQDNDGNTPLHIALMEGQINIVQLLLSKDPDINVENKLGFSCLHYAMEKGYTI